MHTPTKKQGYSAVRARLCIRGKGWPSSHVRLPTFLMFVCVMCARGSKRMWHASWGMKYAACAMCTSTTIRACTHAFAPAATFSRARERPPTVDSPMWAGCAFAFRLQDLAMQLSVGLVSASALIEGIEQTLATRTGARVHWEAGRRDATQWLLAAASLSALYTRSTRPPLPLLAQAALLPARLLLLPVDGIERLLRHLSRRLAKEDFLNSLSGPPTPLPKGFRF
eukprot:6181511-Pleurochrysis_carterae.AAC.1